MLIVGLGNPGAEHKLNRHNIGYMVIDKLAEDLGLSFSRMRFDALVVKDAFAGEPIVLAKPRTYMNLSGRAVAALARFYKLTPERILVAYDDVDLDFESVRLRPEGGSAGQKGMKSIITSLGTQAFPRLRMGIGRPPGRMGTPAYVLQDFSKEEREILPFVLDHGSRAIQSFVRDGIDQAMNQFNRRKDE